MNDELKTVEGDAEASLAHVDAVIHSDALKTKEAVVGWGKAHIAWLVGVACLVVGLVLGYHLHK